MNTDSSFLQVISPEIAQPILVAFTESAVLVFGIAAVISAIAFALSFFLPELELSSKSGMQQQAESNAAAAMH